MNLIAIGPVSITVLSRVVYLEVLKVLTLIVILINTDSTQIIKYNIFEPETCVDINTGV